jgi:hypothetical protein
MQRKKVLVTSTPVDAGGLGAAPETAITFTVRYADNGAVLARQDLFSSIRYITEDEGGRQVTERSFPMGELRITTIMLVLESWDVRPSEDAPAYPLTPENVIKYTAVDELEWLYNQIIDMNPIWGGTEGK